MKLGSPFIGSNIMLLDRHECGPDTHYALLAVTKLDILMAVTMKITLFWDVTPCRLLAMFWKNLLPLRSSEQKTEVAGKYLPDYKASHPRRQEFSYYLSCSFIHVKQKGH
jgi:hypothetical protein